MSSVASIYAFSISERLISDHRSSLKSETVKAIICEQHWLLPLYNSEDSNEDIEE